MRLFEPNGNEATYSPTPRNEAKTPHCKILNPVMELTTVEARGRVSTYGLPAAISLQTTKGKTTERNDANGNEKNV